MVQHIKACPCFKYSRGVFLLPVLSSFFYGEFSLGCVLFFSLEWLNKNSCKLIFLHLCAIYIRFVFMIVSQSEQNLNIITFVEEDLLQFSPLLSA